MSTRVNYLNLIGEKKLRPPFLGGLTIYSSMKLLSVLKNLINEAKSLLDQYEVDGYNVDIFYNDHSNLSINSSKYGRQSIEDIKDSMVDILDIIVEVSMDILSSPSKVKDKDHSILVRNFMIGMDYHFWVTSSPDGGIYLIINTSIGHPKFLPDNQNDKKIIITKNGDAVIREQFEGNNFTKIVRGDIIIYIN